MLRKLVLTAAFLGAAATSAGAVTLNHGSVTCEGAKIAPGTACSQNIKELGQTYERQLNLTFANSGSAKLTGALRGSSNSSFADRATFNGTGVYRFFVELIDIFDNGTGNGEYDADLRFGAGSVFTPAVTLDQNNRTATFVLDFDALGGAVKFDLNAAGGQVANGSAAYYAVSVAAVPLPATGLLLLGGLGAIAARRRRKS